MARIYPFRALRYNPALVRLEDVVTQPYDKITPSMQQSYYQRSPYNLVRIILGLPELFDTTEGENVYSRAARDLSEWRRSNILAQDQTPSIFAYSQRFTVPGSSGTVCERHGFIALGELCDYSQNVVFRHEQTLSKPKSDRMNLLKATHAHFGQIFMLYSDPAQMAEKILFKAGTAPDAEVIDEYGVAHRISRVNDANTINIMLGTLADKKLIIADGHHRYETALAYSKERAPAHAAPGTERNSYALPQPPFPEAAVMMTFVNMESDGLVILPTHRVVFGLKNFSPADFVDKAKPYFDIEELAGTETADLQARLSAAGKDGTALLAATARGNFLLKAKPAAVAAALNGIGERQRQLDVVQLHSLVLEKLLGITPEAILEQRNLRYIREGAEAIEQVTRGEANVAFLMNPVTMNQLREVAFAGDVMPQKSTDFFPKLLSGLAIYALD